MTNPHQSLVDSNNPNRMQLFNWGLEPHLFSYNNRARALLRSEHGIDGGFVLLYAGRVSHEKNLGFLFSIYEQVLETAPNTRLLIAGTGPHLQGLIRMYAHLPGVHFSGRISRQRMASFYSVADLFVFPGNPGASGTTILESLFCGLTPLVSSAGGYEEILQPCGTIIDRNHPQQWVEHILACRLSWKNAPDAWERQRRETVHCTLNHFRSKSPRNYLPPETPTTASDPLPALLTDNEQQSGNA